MGKFSDIFRMTSRERNGLIVLLSILVIVLGVMAISRCSSDDGTETVEKVEKAVALEDSIAENADSVISLKEEKPQKTRGQSKKSTGKKSSTKSAGQSQRNPMSERPLN